jgi:predicted RNA-binding protein
MTDNQMLTALRHLEEAARSTDCYSDDAQSIIQFLHGQRDKIIQRRLRSFVEGATATYRKGF